MSFRLLPDLIVRGFDRLFGALPGIIGLALALLFLASAAAGAAGGPDSSGRTAEEGLRPQGPRDASSRHSSGQGVEAVGTASAPGPSFGSRSVLESCWPQGEHDVTPQDKPSEARMPASRSGASGESAPEPAGPPLPPELRGSIRSVKLDADLKLAALTFDLCEGPREVSGYDGKIVATLRKLRVKATFFAGGKWMASHPEQAMQLMADPLFELGSHSWSHANFRLLDTATMEAEIFRAQTEYGRLRDELSRRSCAVEAGAEEMARVPRAPALFRFPFGACNRESLDLLAEYGLSAVQWDVVTGDPDPHQTAAGIAGIVLRQVRPGSIIICHANGRGHGTAEALQLFIPELHRRGYEFVTVTELLRSGRPRAESECYEMRKGDNLRYDRKFERKKDRRG